MRATATLATSVPSTVSVTVADPIGAGEIQTLAANLEASVKAGDPAPLVLSHLDAVEGPLAALVEALDRALPAEAQPVGNPPDLAGACRRLEGLLADDDAEALEVLESGGRIWEALGEPSVRLVSAVRNYAFDEALGILREVCALKSIDLKG